MVPVCTVELHGSGAPVVAQPASPIGSPTRRRAPSRPTRPTSWRQGNVAFVCIGCRCHFCLKVILLDGFLRVYIVKLSVKEVQLVVLLEIQYSKIILIYRSYHYIVIKSFSWSFHRWYGIIFVTSWIREMAPAAIGIYCVVLMSSSFVV